MEQLEQDEAASGVNTEMESWHQVPADEDTNQCLGETLGLPIPEWEQGVNLSPDGQMSFIGDTSIQLVADRFESLQLELQDSCLSPSLNLIPQGTNLIPSESTLLHQTDLEFVPLRGTPDLSMTYERYSQMSHLNQDVESKLPNRSLDQASLSQHPLVVTDAPSESASSCCSLSQHSLSPSNDNWAVLDHDAAHVTGQENRYEREMEGAEQTNSELNKKQFVCSDEALNSTLSAHSLPKLLKKDVCVVSSCDISPMFETAHTRTDTDLIQPIRSQNKSEDFDLVNKQNWDSTSAKEPKLRLSGCREQPQGASSSVSQGRTNGSVGGSLFSGMSAISNITFRSTSVQPDKITSLSHRLVQLHSDATFSASGSKKQSESKVTPSTQSVSSDSAGGVCVPGLQRVLWSSGQHTDADGSFLTSHPVSQSTPAVALGKAAPVPSELLSNYSHEDTVSVSLQKSSQNPDQTPALDLSATKSQIIPEGVHVSSLEPVRNHTQTPIQPQMPHTQESSSTRQDMATVACRITPPDPSTLASLLPTSDRRLDIQRSLLSSGRVHSLPSLSYLQKVDAWKANQSSSRSFYDELALQGFDGVPPKRQAQDSISEALNHILSPQTLQRYTALDKTSFRTNICAPSSQPDCSMRFKDVSMAGGAPQPTSPFNHSNSHSSLVTVVPVQQEGTQLDDQLSLKCSDSVLPGINSVVPESALLSSGASNQKQSDEAVTSALKSPPLLHFGQCSKMTLNNPNPIITPSSFQGNYHGEQTLHESLGAGSSVSLEMDNYAPCWTSLSDSPSQLFELNIDDRIPLYLRNLGIDQSPSKILNPFTHRGPIREPEFSPTDLCTIKGSVGTPTKSTLASEGGSPQKESCSSSSVLSADSSASLTQRLAVQKPDRPASPGSVRMARCQTGTPPESCTPQPACTGPQESDTPHKEGSYSLPTQLSLESAPPSGVKDGDSTFVGSATLQEIRHLLGQAESLVSGHSSLISSQGSHCDSESRNSFLSIGKNTHTFNSESSLSGGERVSLVLAQSSSDSALKESSSSCGVLHLSAQTDHMTKAFPASSPVSEGNLKSRDLHVAPRRSEPEGCSAVDPDRVRPTTMSVNQVNDPSTSHGHQHSQESVKTVGDSLADISPAHSSADVNLGVLSDGTSDGSLAARVAKILQSESPVVTSCSSSMDSEASRAREWRMVKVSGGQCQILDLPAEDRKKIEEIKKELLLQLKLSSASESSTQSSIDNLPQPTFDFAAVHSAKDFLSEQLQRASQTLQHSTIVPQHTPLLCSLEDKVHQIALREGFSLTTPLASIAVATIRSTPPQPDSQHLQTLSSRHTRISCASHRTDALVNIAEKSEPNTEDKTTTMENKETERVVESDERKDENKHQEVKRSNQSAGQEVPFKNLIGKRDISPVLEPGSVSSQLEGNHITLSHKSQQSTSFQTHLPATEACSIPELQAGIHDHNLDVMPTPNTLKGALPPVASVSRTASISEDSGASKSQNSRTVTSDSWVISSYREAVTLPQRLAGSSKSLSVPTAPLTTLLPYKPHGSSELFYMPQVSPKLTPSNSETTMESSHPGSDDAVPPRFAAEVLGFRELEDDRLTPKHKEGIYSKRAKMKKGIESTVPGENFNVSKAACIHRDSSGPLCHLTTSNLYDWPNKDQGTLHCSEQEEDDEAFSPLNMEVDYSTDDLHHPNETVQKYSMTPENLPIRSESVTQTEQVRKAKDIVVEIDSSLDQLWCRFNECWSLQETRSTNRGDVSLLERLERLSHLLHSSSPYTPAEQAHRTEERDKIRSGEPEQRRAKIKGANREEKERYTLKRIKKTAWEKEPLRTNQTLLEEKHEENDYRFPAERDESVSVSAETSSSRSTIDTQRLLRAFGPHRVSSGEEVVPVKRQPSGSLLKLYNTINTQKKDQGKVSSRHHVTVATETSSTNDSTESIDLSSSSIYTLPSSSTKHSSSTKKKKIRLVSRGIQAGDLEIVVNGTRSHTRDVGTTFPSPDHVRDTRARTANDELLAISTQAASASSKPLLTKQSFKNKQTCGPNALSWFVITDDLKGDAWKENEPQGETVQPGDKAWFEPFSRVQPWREPLRECHIQMERERLPVQKHPLENTSSCKSSPLVFLSLQDALQLNRPEFVSRSRERMKRLCLLAEDRKLQTIFNKERQELFNRSPGIRPATAAPAYLKRVIPVSEMVQRSKRIYCQLPEVQKRINEEKRKKEYSTHRLNAKLFTKKVTNRVLGRRKPWQ